MDFGDRIIIGVYMLGLGALAWGCTARLERIESAIRDNTAACHGGK